MFASIVNSLGCFSFHPTDKDDEIHVFCREQYHAPFTYQGKAVVQTFELFADKPSTCEFGLESLNPGISGEGGSGGIPF
jgi:hypothetical protein